VVGGGVTDLVDEDGNVINDPNAVGNAAGNDAPQEETNDTLNRDAYNPQPSNPEELEGGKLGDSDVDLLSEDPFHNDSRNFRKQAPLHLFTDEEKAQLVNEEKAQSATLEEGNGDAEQPENGNSQPEQQEDGNSQPEPQEVINDENNVQTKDDADDSEVNNEPAQEQQRQTNAAEGEGGGSEAQEVDPAQNNEGQGDTAEAGNISSEVQEDPATPIKPFTRTREQPVVRSVNDGIAHDNPRLWGVS